MGILNLTPDSFSNGSLYLNTAKALDHALNMEKEGADIIDVGGESTRPGSKRMDAEEELSRVSPIIEMLSKCLHVPISIDTYKASVAKAAIKAGASIINDISGFQFDPEMPSIAAEHNVPVVIMHIKGTPYSMQKKTDYDDLLSQIISALKRGIETAKKAGICEEHIIVDPGIGFGKDFNHNLQILNKLSSLKVLKKPILIGPSRKAFIGDILGTTSPLERIEGTAAAVAIGIMNGASIIRVHDVKYMAKVAKVADAIKRMDY